MPEKNELEIRIAAIRAEQNPITKFQEHIKFLKSAHDADDATLNKVVADDLGPNEATIWSEYSDFMRKITQDLFENHRDELLREAELLLKKIETDNINPNFSYWMRSRLTPLSFPLQMKNWTWESNEQINNGFFTVVEGEKNRWFLNEIN